MAFLGVDLSRDGTFEEEEEREEEEDEKTRKKKRVMRREAFASWFEPPENAFHLDLPVSGRSQCEYLLGKVAVN